MENFQEDHPSKFFTSNLAFIAICFFIGLAGFGYILAILPGLDASSSDPSRTCITGAWKFGLITTHVLTFGLIPLAMRVFYQSLKYLGLPSKAIFGSQLGLAFIMVAIASEIGWHVTQCWYYQNDFTILNFMFYFFLISAFALWSDSFSRVDTVVTKMVNLLFAISLLVVSILYPLGFEHNSSSFKIPIYVALTLVFSILTYRSHTILQDWKVALVPFFSVGVNLVFIILLDNFGGDPYFNPQPIFNASFHILHDLCGTEAGVAIFTWLIYKKGMEFQSSAEQLTTKPILPEIATR